MDIATLESFFMWCAIINGGLLLVWTAACMFCLGWVHRMHSWWFPMSREAFNITVYAFLGGYKIVFIVFCLTPYIALVIMS